MMIYKIIFIFDLNFDCLEWISKFSIFYLFWHSESIKNCNCKINFKFNENIKLVKENNLHKFYIITQ